jgi:hypothetical protein
LGYPDQALKNTRDMVHLAHEVAHLFTLAFALNMVVMFHQFRQEETAVRERVEAQLTLATEQGVAYRTAVATIVWGWVLATSDQTEEAICGQKRRHTKAEQIASVERLLIFLGRRGA